MWLQALQWVADNAQYPAIVTASVSGEYSATLDQAVQTLTEIYGIPVVVSAGRSVRPETTEPVLCGIVIIIIIIIIIINLLLVRFG